MKSPKRFVVMMLLALTIVQIVWGAAIGNSTALSPAVKSYADDYSRWRAEIERIKREESIANEPSGEGWQKAIGKWRNKAGSLVFELVDLNKAEREYYPDKSAKVEGYVRKVPPTWSDKIHAGGLIFIGNKVEGGALSGKWIQAPQKGDCPKMPVDYSSCTLKINTAGEMLTSEVESKQYAYPKCQWSDKVISQTFTYYRVK
jgi:hypothetical protein